MACSLTRKRSTATLILRLGWGITMMKISMIAMVPVMTIAGLLLKPVLVTKGVFITAIIVEFFMAFLVSDYYENH